MEPGARLGRFVVDEDLGHGGMGGVYRGRDTQSGAVVAIKTLDANMVPEKMVPRFVREAESYRKLEHPNIVAYLGSGVEGGRIYYIVLEHLRGQTLEEVIQGAAGPLPLARCLDIAEALLGALQHAHGRGIVHRDVKPQNIMVTDEGVTKLLDFGIAAADDRLVQTAIGSVLGSFCYSSPEQNQGQEIDERTDLYSAGLVFWELLTGRRAFQADNLLAVTACQVTEGVAPPSSVNPQVPAQVDVLAGGLLETNRSERPADAGEALESLRSLREVLDV